MNRELVERWLVALRSGEYKQTDGALRRKEGEEYHYCCLGVACDLVKGERWTWDSSGSLYSSLGYPPNEIRQEYSLDHGLEQQLVDMNDSGKSFNEIADYIEYVMSQEENDEKAREAAPF